MKKTFEEVIKESKPSLVVFFHAGEENDPEIESNINGLREKYGDRINILRVDESYDQRIAQNYSLSQYPTYILIKEGEELMRESGHKKIGQLSEMIDRAF